MVINTYFCNFTYISEQCIGLQLHTSFILLFPVYLRQMLALPQSTGKLPSYKDVSMMLQMDGAQNWGKTLHVGHILI